MHFELFRSKNREHLGKVLTQFYLELVRVNVGLAIYIIIATLCIYWVSCNARQKIYIKPPYEVVHRWLQSLSEFCNICKVLRLVTLVSHI